MAHLSCGDFEFKNFDFEGAFENSMHGLTKSQIAIEILGEPVYYTVDGPQTVEGVMAEIDEQFEEFDLELERDEEARILQAVGLDDDLEPLTIQTPDWVLMCSIMNGEDIDDDTDDR